MNIPTREVLCHHVSRALVALTGQKPAHVRVADEAGKPVVHVTFAAGDHDSAAIADTDLESLAFIQHHVLSLSPWALELIADRVVLSLIWHTRRGRPDGGK